MISGLQYARKEVCSTNAVLLEAQLHQMLHEWRAQLSVPSPASSLQGNSREPSDMQACGEGTCKFGDACRCFHPKPHAVNPALPPSGPLPGAMVQQSNFLETQPNFVRYQTVDGNSFADDSHELELEVAPEGAAATLHDSHEDEAATLRAPTPLAHVAPLLHSPPRGRAEQARLCPRPLHPVHPIAARSTPWSASYSKAKHESISGYILAHYSGDVQHFSDSGEIMLYSTAEGNPKALSLEALKLSIRPHEL